MALFNTMGESSSPLFLTADTSGGLDLGPLEYYYKKKEAADADLAKKLTTKPELPEFKADALPGQKDVLELMYKKSMYDIKKGVEKYGGLWGIYANSEEGKRDIAGLNITQYNLEMGETNKKRFQGASASVTQEGKSNVRYLDSNGRPMVIKDKNGKVRYATNEDMLQERSKDRAYDPQTGELLAMDFNYTRGDSKTINTEIAALASAVKSSSSSTASPVFAPQQDPNTGEVFYGSSIMQGHDAYNYISYVKQGGSSNKSQLNAAVEVLRTNLSKDSQDAIVNEIYDGAEGKRAVVVNMPVEDNNGKVSFKQQRVDYKKFDEDDVYRQQVIDAYTTDRVLQGVQPFVQTSSTYEESYNILGKAEGKGYGDKENTNLGITALITESRLNPSTTSKVDNYISNGDGTFTLSTENIEQYRGEPVESAYSQFNASLAANPTRLSQQFGNTPFILGGYVQNVTGETDPVVHKVLGFSMRPPMVQDDSGQWRNINKQEQALYDAAFAKKQSNQPLTEADKQNLARYGPQYFMDLQVSFGSDADSEGFKVINQETGQPESIQEGFLNFDWTSDASDPYGVYESNDNFGGVISIPASSFMGLEAQTDKQFEGNVELQKQRLEQSFNTFIQLQQNQQNSLIQMSDNPDIEFE